MGVMNKYRFEGPDGIENMQDVLKMFRYGFKTISNIEVESVFDHSSGTDGVTGTGAIEYRLADGSSVEIRPSVSAPEIEVCISVASDNEESVARIEAQLREDIERIMYLNYNLGYCCE